MIFLSWLNANAFRGSYFSPADEWLEVVDPCCGFDEAICTVLRENNGSSFYCNASPGKHQQRRHAVQCRVYPNNKSKEAGAREGAALYSSLFNGPCAVCSSIHIAGVLLYSLTTTKPATAHAVAFDTDLWV